MCYFCENAIHIVMIDYQTTVQVRECAECKHYLSGCKCRAFNHIPLEFFTDATRHDKPLPERVGYFVFEAAEDAPKTRVYAAD